MESVTTSNVSSILSAAQERFRRMDELERRLNDRAVQTRRRIQRVLESHVATQYRQSHLRCFVTHQYENIPPTETSPLPASEWTVRVEGSLLVGHLDHESAAEHDARTGYVAPSADAELDRSSKLLAEPEEDEVKPIKFTHFFDKVTAEFQPVYAPKPNPMAAAAIAKLKQTTGADTAGATTTKKRRAGASKAAAAAAKSTVDVDEIRRSLVVNPQKQQIVWTKSMSEDAEAFDLTYRAPPPHESRYQIHCVIAKLQLFPSVNEPRYKITPKVFEIIMPNHVSHEESAAAAAAAAAAATTKKRATPDLDPPLPDIPFDPEIHVPESWSMKDLSLLFYQYIEDNNLFDDALPSTVVCNDKLQTLFQLERFPFSQLQTLLLSQNLVRHDPQHNCMEPIRLTYICKISNATNAPPPDFFSNPTEDEQDQIAALLQLDMDVWVPSFFPYRCREILRRIKRREAEYISSRNRARYILMNRKARDEEQIKSIMEEVVVQEQLGRDMIPIQLALAEGATFTGTPTTEACAVAHTEARLSLLMDRLEQECTRTQETWQDYQSLLEILHKAAGVTSDDVDGGDGHGQTPHSSILEPELMDTSS
jgi:hypothetical protein